MIFPAALPKLVKLTNELLRAGQRDRVAVAEAPKSLLVWLIRREALARRPFSTADVAKMRKTLVRYAATDKAGDYAAAEQIVLGVESLSYSLGDRNARKAALDALYIAVKNDTSFSPRQFASAAASAQRSFQ